MAARRFAATLVTLALAFTLVSAAALEKRETAARRTVARHDGVHDFDWSFGKWHTTLERRQRPLTGSNDWVRYEGTTTVTPVWNGRANLVELDVAGSAGRIEGLSLRLYEPATREWTLNFANAASGTLFPPTRGKFRDGRGEFFADETLDDKPIRVRFTMEQVGPDSWRFEQAFSPDAGATWETNWIATDTRVPD